MKFFLLACAGGAIGAGGRHLINILTVKTLGLATPWATFAVNVTGSLLMGCVIAFIAHRMPEAVAWRIFLATGILGGFTTFSAFSLDAFSLMARGDVVSAATYILGSVTASIGACITGYWIFRVYAV